MKHINFRSVFKFLTVLALFTLISSPCFAKDPKKVAVLPFNFNTDKDLSFLQNGIIDMIGSRMAWKGEVIVIEREIVQKKLEQYPGTVSRDTAIIIGEALEADYVIFGSMTVLGESVSLDASILDVYREEESVTAYNQSESLDDIIPTINKFAQDINAKVMGRYRQPVYASAFGGEGEFESYMDEYIEEISHTQSFDAQFTGLDVGDVDGDGKNEVVLIDKDTVYIYKWMKKSFVLFTSYRKRIDTGLNSGNIYVSLGDFDKNGNDEIYVSRNSTTGISSFILEWQDARLNEIIDGQEWLFRVADVPGRGLSLLGQKLDFQQNFSNTVYFLERQEGKIKNPEYMILPQKANIFNFTMGDITGDNKLETLVFYSFSDYLYLYDHQIDQIWKSEDYYGGLEVFIENEDEEWDFISPPMLLTDIDENGHNEILICQNSSSTGRRLKRMRMYNAGSLHLLSWDKHDLTSIWKSTKLPPISGYRMADIDNDKKPELIVTSVIKPKGIKSLGADAYNSELYIFELE